MTRPTPKEIKAIAEVSVEAEIANRIPIRSGRHSKALPRSPARCHSTSSPRRSFSCKPCRPSNEHPSSSDEPALLSVTEVAQAIAQRRVSSREVTQSCLDRIKAWQPRLNAFMAIEADEALAAADAADAKLAKGGLGALHGVPLAHKDMYYEQGKVVTCGSKIRREFVATTTSTALQRLKDAGSIRLGSLQMAEFAYGPTGQTRITARCIIRGRPITSPAARRRVRARRSPQG